MSRDRVDPEPPGYRPCVGIMLINRDGLVWVGRRADAPGDAEGRGSWWQMPQGGIDDGEDPATAALRELAEETGIRERVDVLAETAGWLRYDLPDHLIGKAWGGKYRGQQQKWFAIRFLGHDGDIDINPPDPDKVEFEAWKWVALADVTGLIVPFKRDVYRQVVEEFAPFARPVAAASDGSR